MADAEAMPTEEAMEEGDGMVEDDDMMGDEDMMGMAVTFRVRIENVSADSMLASPFAPGVWVLHSQAGPIFVTGAPDRGEGLEALAEDGSPAALAEALTGMGDMAGVFNTPAGADQPGPLLPGNAYEFEFTATTDTPNLSFVSMFVQSNDLFIGPDENGIALFDMDGHAISGDVTEQILLWDAGTEANEEPGVGENQAPRQSAPNTGPADEDNTVRVVNDMYSYPAVSELVKVTIEIVE
ncbi:MAG: spondin domain-containing protein [Caldilineaceae bacterium]